VLAERHLDVGADGFGLLIGAIGFGAATGPFLLTRLTDNPRRPAFVFGPYLLRGLVDLVVASVTALPVALAARATYGLGTSTGAVTFNSLLQAEVRPELRGRVFAGMNLLWQAGRLASLAGGGLLADTDALPLRDLVDDRVQRPQLVPQSAQLRDPLADRSDLLAKHPANVLARCATRLAQGQDLADLVESEPEMLRGLDEDEATLGIGAVDAVPGLGAWWLRQQADRLVVADRLPLTPTCSANSPIRIAPTFPSAGTKVGPRSKDTHDFSYTLTPPAIMSVCVLGACPRNTRAGGPGVWASRA
jgi:hypothetical protein